jgi:anthranilate phosphoribosyltransferase
LVAAGKATSPAEAATLAAEAIDNGNAKTVVERLAETTNSM